MDMLERYPPTTAQRKSITGACVANLHQLFLLDDPAHRNFQRRQARAVGDELT